MKKTILFLFTFCVSLFSFSQGQITSIVVYPTNPTTADSVKVYVNLSFSSGGCEPDNMGSSTNGNTTTASALHCLGPLTVICTTTDTFDLGYLQVGAHQFSFTLSSGFGGPGCSPGIVPDDDSTINFMVASGLGIAPTEKQNLVQFFPNPMTSSAQLNIDGTISLENLELIIADATGRIIFTKSGFNSHVIQIANDDLSKGIYFYQLRKGEQVIANDKFVVE